MFNFLKYRKVYYAVSIILILASLVSLVLFRLKFGIDFSGGTLMEVEFKENRITNEEVSGRLADLGLQDLSLQQTGEKGLLLRMKNIDEGIHQQILAKFEGAIEEKSFESVGPIVGKELQQKTWVFTVLVSLAITLFIAFAFRKSSYPVSSWRYGIIAAVVAFFHDILIPLGVFSLLGKYLNVTITIPIIVGVLTILGYSVHNSIVVFDRVRENLSRTKWTSFEEVVNKSLNQTIVRSINTSLSTLIVLAAMFFFGGETLRYFVLILILGITTGTYSSVFIASSLLVDWVKKVKKR